MEVVFQGPPLAIEGVAGTEGDELRATRFKGFRTRYTPTEQPVGKVDHD